MIGRGDDPTIDTFRDQTMITTTIRRARRLGAALAAGALLLACADAEQAKAAPTAPELATPGIHPVVVVASQTASEATLELHLKRVAVTDKVASFQGELTYDRAALRLAGASIPAGITGAWNEVRPGTVRFTGVSVDGLADGAVLVLRFGATAPVAADALSLTMEEIVASEGFKSLKAEVQQRGRHPVLVRTRP